MLLGRDAGHAAYSVRPAVESYSLTTERGTPPDCLAALTHFTLFLRAFTLMTRAANFTIRSVHDEDRAELARWVMDNWGADIVVSRGTVHRPHELDGFVAIDSSGEMIGMVVMRIENKSCEIVIIESKREGCGIGSALLEAAHGYARGHGCDRVWLITTNDNVNALAFYQKRGYAFKAVHCNAIENSRKLKSSIPLIAENGIPIRDELELEIRLKSCP